MQYFFLTWGFIFRKGSLKCYSFESYVTHDLIELVIIDSEKIVNVFGEIGSCFCLFLCNWDFKVLVV